MSKVRIKPLIADGLSKWLWFHRGMKLFVQSKGKQLWLYCSMPEGKNVKLLNLRFDKEFIYVPSLNNILKGIEELSKK